MVEEVIKADGMKLHIFKLEIIQWTDDADNKVYRLTQYTFNQSVMKS